MRKSVDSALVAQK